MNSPQFPTRSPAFSTQPPEVSGFNKAPCLNEGGGANTTVVVFNGKNVNKYVLSNFFKEMTQGGMRQLAEDTCAQAARVHDKFWKRDNLVKDLEAYGLPVDCNRRAQLTDRKTSAVMNVFLKVKEESEKAIDQGGRGDNLEVAKGLCDLLNGTDVRVDGKIHTPHFVDMEFFAGEMNKCQQKLDAARSAIGSLGQESQGINEPGLPPAENPAFTMEGKPLLPQGNAPTMTPSAPPNYDVVQAEKRLAELNTQIALLQQGVTQDFLSQSFQHQLSLVQMEIVRLGFNLPVNLQEQYIQAKANLDGIQQQQLALQEGGRGIEFHGQIDELKRSLAQNEPKNKTEIKALERKVNALDDQIGKLSSPESGSHKEELKERLSELKISISQRLSVVTAFETLACLKSDLEGFQYQQLPAEVSSFSAKCDDLDEIVTKLPSGAQRNQLIKEFSILKQSFSEIQKNVQQHHLITQLDNAENIIKVMEYDVSGSPKSYQVEQARAALLDAESLSLKEGTDNCFARLSNLKERLSKFESSAAAASAAAATAAATKMQSSARVDAKKVIEQINELIRDADGRLRGEEKNREAVSGIHLNQTHMGEVQSILDAITEKILNELNGGDLRDERERLQSMRSSLLGRLKTLQGGGASSGQSTAASAQPVSGNQDHTEVENIRKALDFAEAPIEALISNPNSSAKDDLITRARSHLEQATQMIGRLTDNALIPLRTELSTRLGRLNKQLNLIESGGGQGQVTPAEPQPEVLLQKGVAVFKKEMDEFGKKGTVSNAGFAAAAGNMSALLSKFAPSQSASQSVPGSHNVLQPVLPRPLVRQNTPLHAGPVMTRPVLTNGDSLASFASALNFTNTIIFDNGSTSTASLGIKPSSEKIKSLVTSTDIPFGSLPFDVRERMIEANDCGNHWPKKIKLVQVYAFAPDESDFNGASFRVRLDSIMPEHHRQIYMHSTVAHKYSPLGANLRMPEGLKQGNPFYEARWSLNEKLDSRNTVSFAHGSGRDNHSNLEDIGFTLVAPVLKALGASAEEATSAEAGFGIPFGIDLMKQPQTVMNELQHYTTPYPRQRYFGFQVPDVTDSVVPDGGALDPDVVSDSESLGTSGINPLALHTESTYGFSSRIGASEIFAKEVGILWVKTVTDLPDVNSPYSLMNWVESNKPEPENLRLPQLL